MGDGAIEGKLRIDKNPLACLIGRTCAKKKRQFDDAIRHRTKYIRPFDDLGRMEKKLRCKKLTERTRDH